MSSITLAQPAPCFFKANDLHSSSCPVTPSSSSDLNVRTSCAEKQDTVQSQSGLLESRLALFGAFLALFFSFGQLNAFGTYQAWYAAHQLSHLAPYTISWIGSLQLCLFFILGYAIGRCFDRYGPRWIMAIGTGCLVAGMGLTSICTAYYQYILAQGILFSIGVALLFYPAIASVSTHFSEYRSTAIGIAMAGSSLGGVAYPILLQKLFECIGFNWGLRTAALITSVGCTVATMLTSRRPTKSKKVDSLSQLKSFCDARFLFLAAGSGIVALGLFNPLFYIVPYSRTIRTTTDISAYALAVMNAGGVLGRILPAYLSDRVGRFNLLIPAAFLSGFSCLVLWVNATSVAGVMTFAGIYGFFSGAFISVVAPCVAQISEAHEFGMKIGMLYSVTSFPSLLGGPIAGALLAANAGSFTSMAIFSGSASVAGSLLLIGSKLAIDRRILVKV